jgi:hypothetical protein
MSARTPRRRFASPFVVTLAAIPTAAAGCNPPPPQPPRVVDPPVVAAPAEPDPVDAGKPREPAKFERSWTVMKIKGNPDCQAMRNDTCPKVDPGKPIPPCNPPPPSKYVCPANLEDGNSIQIVLRAGATECFQKYEPIKCPQGAKCNPPPPRKLKCPE